MRAAVERVPESLARDVELDALGAGLREATREVLQLMPNLPKAEALCAGAVRTLADMERAGKTLLDFGARAVLIKGGHMEGDPVDLYLDSDEQLNLPVPRIDTLHTHGTGCTYSAAVTAGLARGLGMLQAIREAKLFVNRAILTNPGLGHGSGPLNHWV